MIPDNFFKITSDSKQNTLGAVGKDEKRPRFEISPEKKKDFNRILSNKEKGDGKDDPDEKLIKNDEDALAELGDVGEGAKKRALKKGAAPFVDMSNQTETLAKDSKVAPRLGKEKPVAPSEEPWSPPYIEKDNASQTQLKGAPVAKEKGDLEQDLGSDSPAMLFSRMAKEGSGSLKQILKTKLSEFIPKRGELEVSYKKKEEPEVGFLLINPVKQDQDIALINLAVISLGSNDLLIDASKLRPVVKIPGFIMDMVEKISNEMKDDMTKTVITLKNSGIFNDVEVTITSFRSAKSELNIQFSNLTQEAKSVLEINLDALKQALNDKGHTVHIITASTIKEEPVAARDETRQQREREEGGQNQQQKRQQQGQQEDEG